MKVWIWIVTGVLVVATTIIVILIVNGTFSSKKKPNDPNDPKEPKEPKEPGEPKEPDNPDDPEQPAPPSNLQSVYISYSPSQYISNNTPTIQPEPSVLLVDEKNGYIIGQNGLYLSLNIDGDVVYSTQPTKWSFIIEDNEDTQIIHQDSDTSLAYDLNSGKLLLINATVFWYIQSTTY